MKKHLLALIISIFTFTIGVGFYQIFLPKIDLVTNTNQVYLNDERKEQDDNKIQPFAYKEVSLETISNNTSLYDGMDVQIETFIQRVGLLNNEWYLGEPFEKKEVISWLDFENSSDEVKKLHSQLEKKLPKKQFKRIKVLVKGKVKDNCKDKLCCFGRSIRITAEEIIQIAPVERFTIPK